MAKDPAFLFYPNDWVGGTMGMTFEEKGAYMEVLMMQFNRGHMTEHMIRQVIGQHWDTIKDKFDQDDQGMFFNERLEFEQEKRKKFSESRRNNKKGKNQYTSKSKDQTQEKDMSGHMTSHMENEIENENRDKNNKVSDSEKTEIRSITVSQEGVDKIVTDRNGSRVMFQKVESSPPHPYTHEIMKTWGLNSFNQHKAMVEIDHWVKERDHKGDLQYAKDQLTAYQELKKVSSQVRCGWKSWIGEKWNENNYQHILEEALKMKGSNNQTKPKKKLTAGLNYGGN